MPAYNAAATLEKTYKEIPMDLVDELILCDDASKDETVAVANSLGIKHIISHRTNKGYGGNQKSLYNKALEIEADIVMVNIIGENLYQVVLGSRILGKGALKGGMPLYKYIANRFLTFAQNVLVGYKLSEYHTGYRAFSKEVLLSIQYNLNSDDFVFDNQMLSQIIYKGYDIAEVTCPTKYFDEASSINLTRSIKYGLGVLGVSLMHRLQKMGLGKFKIYSS